MAHQNMEQEICRVQLTGIAVKSIDTDSRNNDLWAVSNGKFLNTDSV